MLERMNKLSDEKSPYLIHHAEDKTLWRPWSDEAFAEARERDVPVFLSIGYSSCRWCKVMQDESFCDPEIAELLNAYFVPVIVDREERFDVEMFYSAVCEVMTGTKGFPLSIIMTSEKKPFYANAYIAKRSAFGRIGLLDLLPQIARAWNTNRAALLLTANETLKRVQDEFSYKGGAAAPNDKLFDQCYEEISTCYQFKTGGFSSAPKSLRADLLQWLTEYAYERPGSEALVMLETTLTRMMRGGIYDHLGFGFHRQSTDDEWRAPYFGKTLYDQALLIRVYTDAFLLTGNADFSRIAQETIAYLIRELLDPKGGYFAAENVAKDEEDARYYVWTERALRAILDEREFSLVQATFNTRKEGNFDETPLGCDYKKSNILYMTHSRETLAQKAGMSLPAFSNILHGARKKMMQARERRPHPEIDDKILVNWNALAISAFARASDAFCHSIYLDAAINATEFILETMYDPRKNVLYHRHCKGETLLEGALDDYAFFIIALVDMYTATFMPRYLSIARTLADAMIREFYDEDEGGFFLSPKSRNDVLFRTKDIFDTALPSGNAKAIEALALLHRLTGNEAFLTIAEKSAKAFWKFAAAAPAEATGYLRALRALNAAKIDAAFVGNPNDATAERFIRETRLAYSISRTIIFKSKETADALSDIAPYTKAWNIVPGVTFAYLRKEDVWTGPYADPKTFSAALRAR